MASDHDIAADLAPARESSRQAPAPALPPIRSSAAPSATPARRPPFALAAVLACCALAAGVYAARRNPAKPDLHVEGPTAAMRTDLRNLLAAQEAFFADSTRYALDLSRMPPQLFTPRPGVSVEILEAGTSGWAGRATHAALPGYACEIYIGKLDHYHPLPGQSEATPECHVEK